MNRSISSSSVAANIVRPSWTRRISRAVFMAFAALSLTLAVGCGGDDDKGGGGDDGGGGSGGNSLTNVSSSQIRIGGGWAPKEDFDRLPPEILKGVGTIDASNSHLQEMKAMQPYYHTLQIYCKVSSQETAVRNLTEYYESIGATVTAGRYDWEHLVSFNKGWDKGSSKFTTSAMGTVVINIDVILD